MCKSLFENCFLERIDRVFSSFIARKTTTEADFRINKVANWNIQTGSKRTMLDLATLFQALPKVPSLRNAKEVLSAAPIPGFPQNRIARDVDGQPVMLFKADPQASYPPAVVLENLAIYHNRMCHIRSTSRQIDKGIFSSISCTSPDKTVQRYFLDVMAMILAEQGQETNAFDVTRVVTTLVELFRALSRPPRESVQGLWAELYFAVTARDPIKAFEAWHEYPEALYDFTSGSQSIEVKSASYGVREHHFSLEQLRVPSGCEVLIASILVETSEVGMSLTELLKEVESKLSSRPDLLLRIHDTVAKTLGSTWRSSLETKFDRQLARSSLLFFDPRVVPSVNPVLPRGVSNVRFVSNLSSVKPVSVDNYRESGSLFSASLR